MNRREGFHRIGVVVTVAYSAIAAVICFLIAWDAGEVPRHHYDVEAGGRKYSVSAYSVAEAAKIAGDFIRTDCNYIGCEGMARIYNQIPIDTPAKARHDLSHFWPPFVVAAAVALVIYFVFALIGRGLGWIADGFAGAPRRTDTPSQT